MKAPNSGKPYSDDQLRLIFSHLPNHQSCLKLAEILGRTPGTIRNIYQWALYADKVFLAKMQGGKSVTQDSHLMRVRCISKEMGWIRSVAK